uniref:InlB B-repeat-containing protein n=1 Tax=Hominenteromicrobium sp. TaxID=3073581 RepID=UPI003A8D6553
MKTRNRLLAATLTLVMILTMLPISAFAENEPPATGTDVTIESVASDEELTTEETGSPSNPGELPGADEDKEQKDGDGEEKTAESNPTPTSEPTSEPAQGANDETPSVTTFTVSFKSNGGTKIEDQQVESGNAVQEPDAPVKEGFVFDGWYEDATFTVVFDFASPVTSNVILYAKWTEAAPESTPELTPEATDDKEEAGAPDNRDDKEDESAPDEAGKTPDAVIGTAPKGAAPALNAPQAGDTKDAGEVNFGLGRTSYTFPNARVGYGIGNEGYGTDRDHINPKPIIIDNYESEDIEVSVSGGQYFDAKFQGHYNFVYYKKISGNSYDFLYFSPKSGLSKGNYTETLTITAKTYANPQRTSTKTITLSFTVTGPTYPVTVTANPTEGGTVSGDGTYLEDDTATVTATANEGYTFDGWYEGGYKVSDQASYTFTVTGGRSLVAVFEPLPTHSVTLASSPASIGAELEGGGNYPSGTEITVKTGKFINGIDGFFKFEGWYAGDTKVSGDVVYTFTVTGDTSLTAKFKKIVVFRYNISSDTVDLGEGIEIGDIQLENAGKRLPYAEHEKITLTWNGNPVGQWWNTTKPMFAVDPTELGVGTHTLTLNYPGSDEYFAASANITVTVVDTHTVTVTADPAEYGTVTGGGTYTDGESVTVTATSSDVSLYGFAGWYNDWNEKVSEDKSYTFTVTEDVTLTAKFKSKLNTLLTAWDGRNAVVDQDAEFYVSFGLESYGNDLYLEMDKVTLTCRGEEIGERHTVHPNGFNVKASELKFGYNLLKLTYPGSEEYLSSSDEFYVTVVKKLALSLEDFAPETSPLDTPYTVSGRLVDENGDPVVGKSLSAYVKHYEGAPSSKYYSATTGENGVFSFDVSEYVPISPSAINVRFTYSEDDEYKYMETTRTIRFIKGHTVTFEMNGGKWGDPSLATEITVEDGEYIPDEYLYTEPQKDGHMFRGWYKDAACTEYFYGKITEDVTLYAKWVEACEITFDLNGGALTDPASGTTMRWDKGVRVRIASLGEAENYFTPPANHFYIGVEIDGKIYEPGADYALTKDITVKLLWQEKTGGTHTVTFILGDGKWEDTSLDTAITVADGECIPYEYVSAGVTRDGYVFEYNWYTDAACTNEFDVYDTPITADIMLYPEYAKLYAVTTDPNGGTIRYPSYETQQIPEGRGLYVHEWSFFYVNAPDGKIFNGAEINGTTYYIGQTYTVKGDTTVKLLWREPTGVKHTVTFNGNGHGTPSTTSIEVEDGKTLYDALNYNDNSISDNGGWLFFAYSLKQDAASLDDEFKFDTPIIKDIDLYAMWYKPVKITTNSLSGGAVNEAYTAPIEVIAEALLPLEFFKVAWGSLPDGLSLDSKTGEISGTPATAGTFSFGILATDVMRNADMREYTVTITGSSATHIVTVTADPAEGGTVTGDGSFDHGSSVTVKAEPNTDYWFEGWYEGENYLSADEEYTIASLEKDMA